MLGGNVDHFELAWLGSMPGKIITTRGEVPYFWPESTKYIVGNQAIEGESPFFGKSDHHTGVMNEPPTLAPAASGRAR